LNYAKGALGLLTHFLLFPSASLRERNGAFAVPFGFAQGTERNGAFAVPFDFAQGTEWNGMEAFPFAPLREQNGG
jgi:hypothetical protein